MPSRLVALSLGALCLLAAACSSGSGPSHSASGTSTTTTTTVSTSTATSTTTAGAVTTTSTGGVPHCAGAYVSVYGNALGAAAGHQGIVLVFTNSGSSTCTLAGYPGVAGLNAQGAQVVQAQRTTTGMMGGLAPGVTTIPVVTLTPGQKASAVVEGTDVPSGTETTCPTYASLLVTPPNTTTTMMIPLSLPGCSGLSVHPVVPGTTGSSSS